jgi:hypothetical protein
LVVNDITAGITRRIVDTFGDGVEVYASQDVPQGLKTPCFFVSLVSERRERQIDRRYRSDFSFCIQYFPVSERSNAEMHETAEQLYRVMEFFPVLTWGLFRGKNMRHVAVDGVLNFFVDTTMFTKLSNPKRKMDELEIEVEVST